MGGQRRIIYVGGLAEVDALGGNYAGRLHPQSDYVFGPRCDLTEQSALMWRDVHKCFRAAKLTSKQRFAYSEAIQLTALAEIARLMDVEEDTVREHVRVAQVKLDGLGISGLGCMTTIIEECGGFSRLTGFVADLLE
jgi:DNA-binding CsgD family transcriptional regulator